MTLWQFSIALIPQRWLDTGGVIGVLFDEDGLDTTLAWRGARDLDLETRFGQLLPATKSWHSSLATWGAHDADDIAVRRERGRIVAVDIRLDLRKPNMALFHAIVELSQELELAILVPGTKKAIGTDMQQLLKLAAESDAAHYSIDPHSYLVQLDTQGATVN